MKLPSFTFSAFLFCFQVVLIILYAVIVDYEAYDPASQVISGYYPGRPVNYLFFYGLFILSDIYLLEVVHLIPHRKKLRAIVDERYVTW